MQHFTLKKTSDLKTTWKHKNVALFKINFIQINFIKYM